uniref:BAR domain-containing protein n=1 Tax=Leersia perrieri TaxID=77586 RepID=A0A0D9W4B9_9ORYZ
MKSPLRKFRGFGLHGHHRERKDHRPPPAKLDELAYAAQEMEEMRNCYDSLLSAAAATTNSVYEFAEAMEEMGTCLLEKTALNYDDDDSVLSIWSLLYLFGFTLLPAGRVLMMLGKAQYELQKFVDSYRTNIINTITNPSESLLKELQVVEEMKDLCDEKREYYEAMRAAYREKGRARHSKTETFSSEQLQAYFLEYQEDAALFIFRLKSLKQGQFRSILTQAARHHSAQLSFFRRGLKYLEALEPHVKAVAEKQHIDYPLIGLDDDTDNDEYSSYQGNQSDDSELSFDYEINDRDKDFPASRSSMDLDQSNQACSPEPLKEHKQEFVEQIKEDFAAPRVNLEIGTQSAPISADNVFDPSTRFRTMNPSNRTNYSYKLPTPADDKNSTSAHTNRSPHSDLPERKSHVAENVWHSSPLVKGFKPNSISSGPVRMPSSTEGISQPLVYPYATSDFKKMKREAFSGPIPSKAGLNKPSFSATDLRAPMNYPRAMSTKSYGPGWQSSVAPKVTPRISSLPTTSPRISELHELPRPPTNHVGTARPGLVGYSGPLVSKRQVPNVPTRASPPSQTASPLPRPPAAMTRSYSIPSNSKRTPILTVNKLLEARHSRESSEVSSPPLTSISLADVSRRSQG